MTNNWTLSVATRNGSGSQSSNTILAKTLFRMGIPIGAKNLFPSNIQGLPTWFTIRVNDEGYVSRKPACDLMLAMNPSTFFDDLQQVRDAGYFIYNLDFKLEPGTDRVRSLGIPFRDLVKEVTNSVKLSKLLTNMIYVGVLSELLGLNESLLNEVIRDQFANKESVVEINIKAVEVGRDYVRSQLQEFKAGFELKAKEHTGKHKDKIFIDGNSATAMGFAFGGCHFMSWYPITPSSSVAENFYKYAEQFLKANDGKHQYAIVQAEDELSAINMVLGAGWAGARAVTPTSGPGLSLMAEAAGLSYFSEIPAVIWDVQRAGPSTGLPTRTLQGDVLSAYHLSHGDTEHIVLFPANAKECYEFAKISFDLAEQLQTLVIVLSDLDLGMNYHMSDKFQMFDKFEHGKVLSAEALDKLTEFKRYADVDKDGIPYRSLPGTPSKKAGYFTRGTGHDEKAGYSEKPEVFEALLNRLKKKHITARQYVPQPVIDYKENADIAIVAYGSSDMAIAEFRDTLQKTHKQELSYLRLRALPMNDEVFDFIRKHKRIYVIEQNRDSQLLEVIKKDLRLKDTELKALCNYDGLPLSADFLLSRFHEAEGNNV